MQSHFEKLPEIKEPLEEDEPTQYESHVDVPEEDPEKAAWLARVEKDVRDYYEYQRLIEEKDQLILRDFIDNGL